MTRAHVRASARIAALAAMTLVLLALYLAGGWRGAHVRQRLVRTWHRGACRIAGLRIRVHGAPNVAPGTLLVGNHVSYLDVCIIGARVDAVFVAKTNVVRWPVVGYLARLAGTLFVDRDALHARAHIAALDCRLAAGATVVVFPEGTCSPGHTVLPFKSTLFESVHRSGGLVQPVTVAYIRDRFGSNLALPDRLIHPWVGDDSLVPHLWSLMKHPGAEADLVFHDPMPATAFVSRKALAAYCRAEAAHGLVLARRRAAVPEIAHRKSLAFSDDWVKYPGYALFQ